MATYSNSAKSGYQWFLSVSESNIDSVNNTSKLTITFYMKKVGTNSSSYNNYGTTAKIDINGTPYTISGFKFDMRKSAVGTTKTIMTKTVTIKHASNGGGQVVITATHNTGISYGNVSVSSGLYNLQKINQNKLSIDSFGITSDTYKENGNYVANKTAFKVQCGITNSNTLKSIKYEVTGAHTQTETFTTNLNNYKTWATTTVKNTGTVNIKVTVTDSTGKSVSKTISATVGSAHNLTINNFYITSDTYKEGSSYIAGKTAFKVKCDISNTHSLKSIKYEVAGAHSQTDTFTTNLSNYKTWATTVVKNSGAISIKVTVTDSTGAVRTKTISATVGKVHNLTINDFYITSDTYTSGGNYIPGKTAFKVKCDVTHTEALKSIKYEVSGVHTQSDTFTTNLNNYLTWATTTVQKAGQVNIKVTITDTSGHSVSRTITAVLSTNHNLSITSFAITSDTYKQDGAYVENLTAFKVKCSVSHSHTLKSIKYEVTGAHSQTETFTTNLNNYLTWATTTVKKSGTVNIKITITDSYGSSVSKTITATVGKQAVAHELSIQDSYLDTSIAKNMVNGAYFKGVSRLGIRFKIKHTHNITALSVKVGSKTYTLDQSVYTNGSGYTVPDTFSTQGNVSVSLSISDSLGKTDTKSFTVFVDAEVSDPDAPVIKYENRTDNYVLLSEGEKVTFEGTSTNIKDYQIIYALSKCDVMAATSIYTSSTSYNGADRSELSSRLKTNATGDLRYVIYKDFDKDDKAIYQDSSNKKKFHLHPTSPNHSSSDKFYALQWFEHAKPGDMVYVYVIERIKKVIVQETPPTPTPTPNTLTITNFYICSDTYKENGAYVAGKTAFKVRCDVDSVNKISNIKYEVTGAHTQSDSFNPPSSNYFTWATTTVYGTGTVTIKVTVTDSAGKTASKSITATVGAASSGLSITNFYITNGASCYYQGVGLGVKCTVSAKYSLASIKYEVTGAHTQSEYFNPPETRYLTWATTPIWQAGTVNIKVTVTDTAGNKACKTISTVVYPNNGSYDMDTPAVYNARAASNGQVYSNSGILYLTMDNNISLDYLDNNLTAIVDLNGIFSNYFFKTFVSEDNVSWVETTYLTGGGVWNPSGLRSFVPVVLPYDVKNRLRNSANPYVYVRIALYSRGENYECATSVKVSFTRPQTTPHSLSVSNFYITSDTYNESGKYIQGKTAFKVQCSISHSHDIKSIVYTASGAYSDTYNYSSSMGSYKNFLQWATPIVQNSGTITFKVTVTDVAGYTASKTITATVGQIQVKETYKYSTQYQWNQLPRSIMFPMCVIPPAPGAIQLYEKQKTNDKYVIQYPNPIYGLNLGDKNPIHLIDVCLIAKDKNGNVLNTNSNKKRDGKNGRSWLHYSERQWHVIVPNSTSSTNNKAVFEMAFDLPESKYPDGTSISVVAFYYTDYYVHPSIYSTSNVLRTQRQNMKLGLQFLEPLNNSISSVPNPTVKIRVTNKGAVSSNNDGDIYDNHDTAVNWNKSTWDSYPLWFRAPRTQDTQLPNFRESERCKGNSPYGQADYPKHKVEFYKAQSTIYTTTAFKDSSLIYKSSAIYKENQLFFKVKNNIIDLGDIDSELLIKNSYIDYVWSSNTENILSAGDNTLEAYTCPYNYGTTFVDFNELNGSWISSSAYTSSSIMPYNLYRRSILKPSTDNWDEVSADILEVKIPYSYLTADTEYAITFNSCATAGFNYQYDTYEIWESEEKDVCKAYVYTTLFDHSDLKNISYTPECLIYTPSYRIIESKRTVAQVNDYDKTISNSIKFKTPVAAVMENIKDKSFTIRLGVRGINTLKLTNMKLNNITKSTSENLSVSKEIDTQVKENKTSINVKYVAISYKLGYIDPMLYDDMIALREFLVSIATQYSININVPWRTITRDKSYLMARDFNDVKTYCFNLFTQLKSKYPQAFKKDPAEFNKLPTIKAGEARVVEINASGKPQVDRRGKTYFSEWDDLVDLIKAHTTGIGSPSIGGDPVLPDLVPYCINGFEINDKQVLNNKSTVTITETSRAEFIISSPVSINSVIVKLTGTNGQSVTASKTGNTGNLYYFQAHVKCNKTGTDDWLVTITNKNGDKLTTTLKTSVTVPVNEQIKPSTTVLFKSLRVNEIERLDKTDVLSVANTGAFFECTIYSTIKVSKVSVVSKGKNNHTINLTPITSYNNEYYFKTVVPNPIDGDDTWTVTATLSDGKTLTKTTKIRSNNVPLPIGNVTVSEFKVNQMNAHYANHVMVLNKKAADIYLAVNTTWPIAKIVVKVTGDNPMSFVRTGLSTVNGKCYYSESISLKYGQDKWLFTIYDQQGNCVSQALDTLVDSDYIY